MKPGVLVIGPTPPPSNGMTTATVALLKSSLDRRFTFTHLDTSDRRGIGNIGRWDWGNIRLALSHGVQFLWLLTSRRPAAVLVQISQNRPGVLRDLLFLLPARFTGRRVIVHLHGGYFRKYYESERWPMRALIRLALSRVAAAIVLGDRFRQIFDGLVPPERIFVVPNGLEADELLAIPRPSGAQQPHVLFLSNLSREKGFLEVVRAALPVAAVVPNVRFTIGGAVHDVQAREDAARFVEQHGLQDRVQFSGPLHGAAKLDAFSSASIFVMPTRYPFEGQPFVILEAMAAGLPVVTTDHGVIAEMIENGTNGFLVLAHDSESLAEKIIALLRDRELCDQMGRVSRERYLQRYTLGHWIGGLGHVFGRATEP